MVRVKAPLFSLGASGTLGKAIVFSSWRGRDYVRRHAIPANPKSGLQVGIRTAFAYITQHWADLTDAFKQDWEDLAAADNITGLDAQVRNGIRLARRNLGWQRDTTTTALTILGAPTSPGATAQPKTVVLDWTDAVTNPGNYATLIYMSTTTLFTPDISNLIGTVPIGTLGFTKPNLIAGTEVFFVIRHMGARGFMGDDSVEVSATPTT